MVNRKNERTNGRHGSNPSAAEQIERIKRGSSTEAHDHDFLSQPRGQKPIVDSENLIALTTEPPTSEDKHRGGRAPEDARD